MTNVCGVSKQDSNDLSLELTRFYTALRMNALKSFLAQTWLKQNFNNIDSSAVSVNRQFDDL